MFSQWTASAFVVEDASYSSVEQIIMAKKARFFHNHRALELILSTPEPQSHKRIERSIRDFDNAIWERERENAILAGTFDFCQVQVKRGDKTPFRQLLVTRF